MNLGELGGFELRTLGMRIFGVAGTYYRLTSLELNRSTPSFEGARRLNTTLSPKIAKLSLI